MITIKTKCIKCNQEKDISFYASGPRPSICADCVETEKATKKERYLNSLKENSIEKRLEVVEEWIYEQKISRNHNLFGNVLGEVDI